MPCPTKLSGRAFFYLTPKGVAAMFRRIALISLILLSLSVPCGAYDSQSVVIRLERGPCYGSCPVYGVTLYGDGTVRYDGKDHVRVRGSQTAVIAPDAVRSLVEEIERSGFFSLNDAYTQVSVTDAPSAVVYVAADGKKKQVSHYLGDFKAPKALETLENRIDEVSGTSRWTAAAAPSAAKATAPKEMASAGTPGLSAVDERVAPGAVAVPDSAIGRETEMQKIVLRRSVATSLRGEAYALQQKGQLREAVIRYRQSLVWWPDVGLESYVVPLESKAGFTASQYRPETEQGATVQAGSPKAVKKTGMVMATIRNRSTLDVTILTRGESADAGTLVRAGEILLRPVQLEPNGEVTFLAVRNSQTLVSKTWYGDAASENVVPTLLYDDNLQDRLFVMTGLK
jgi:hypothetical protein